MIRLSRKGTAAVSALPLGDDQGDVVVLFVGREGTDVGGDSKLVRLRGLWPPEPGGGFALGAEFPLAGEDVLEHVFYYAPVGQAKADVSLKTFYKGHHHTRDLLLDDAEFAQRLASWLRQETGRTIADLGQLEVD